MDPEVIFILILILFSMIEGALRKKKGARKQLPRGTPPPEGWPTPGDFPEGQRQAGPEAPAGRRTPEGAQAPSRPQRTAEGMVPADVWKEIEALARGDVEETLQRRRQRSRQSSGAAPPKAKPAPAPAPDPPKREPSKWRQMPTPPSAAPEQQPELARSRDPRPREFRREATGPSPAAPQGEARSEAPERLALRHRTQKKAKKVPKTEAELHHGFRGPHALKLAFVAREVLGRPLALRDFGEEEFWSS